jgi:predicted enzyme related to lactoylglutathione lyase
MTGEVVWYELMTSDVEAARGFYEAVLGWKIDRNSSAPNGYRMIAGSHGMVGGALPLPPGARNTGMKPCWVFYLNVPDADAAAAKIKADGGAIHIPGVDVPGAGRWCFVADPQGANFYVMTPSGPPGSATSHRPATPGYGGWHELHTSDGVKAFAFYKKHFGWSDDGAIEMGPMGTYQIFKIGEVQSGGVMNDRDLPRPQWMIYFNVDDIDAAAQRVKAARGTIAYGPAEVPGGNHIINAVDPQGARFDLVGPKR